MGPMPLLSDTDLIIFEGGLAAAYVLAVGAVAVGWVPMTPLRMKVARNCFWAACAIFAAFAIMWGISSSMPTIPRLIIVGALCALAGVAATETARFLRGEQPISEGQLSDHQGGQGGQGGKGGSGEIFGKNGTVIGGRGGSVGPGGLGRGGDGGGGIVHGDGAVIIGGDGGSVDGTNIWYPPAQSGYIHHLESQGLTPDFNVQYPGAGGATGGWLERQRVVVQIREDYFKQTGKTAKIASSKIEDVPLRYINVKLKEAGFAWRAQIQNKYWYLYYTPDRLPPSGPIGMLV